MKNTLRSRFLTSILILNAIGFGVAIAGDVSVQSGDLNADRDLNAGRDLNASGDLDVGDDATVGWDLDVYNIVYTGALDASGSVLADDVYSYYDIEADGDVEADDVVGYGIGLFGKVYSSGGYDPPYVLYDKQTREQIINRIKREVPPDKQNGAALFFNADTKRLEVYIAREGKFYDLQGNVTHTLSRVEPATTTYEDFRYLDKRTGKIETWQKPVENRYRFRRGFTLNDKTGQFINRDTGAVVSREQALEYYVPSEGNYYDLQGNLIRSEPKAGETQYALEYYFDRRTGEVKPRLREIVERYVIKEGFKFDRKTGKFIDKSSGAAVSQEAAIEVVTGL